MFDGDDVPNYALCEDKIPQNDIVRTVAKDMADGEYAWYRLAMKSMISRETIVQGESKWFLA